MARAAVSQTTNRYRHLGIALFMVAVVVVIGTFALVRIEDLTVWQAFFQTMITLSTVGFGEVQPLSQAGEIVLTIEILCGMILIGYVSVAVGGIVVEGNLRRFLGGRMMRKELDKLRGHYIICGFGRMGRIVSDELISEGEPHVIVTDDPEAVEDLREEGRLAVLGDATEDENLQKAGIERAKGLVASVSSDVANLYITLTARELSLNDNPDLYILARAAEDKAIRKLKHAGANRVVSPYHIGGSRLAMALLRPTVFDYLEVLQHRSDIELCMEELKIEADSPLADKRLRETPLRSDYDLIVIGVLGHAGEMVFNPGPEQTMAAGDRLIILGGRRNVARMQQDLCARS